MSITSPAHGSRRVASTSTSTPVHAAASNVSPCSSPVLLVSPSSALPQHLARAVDLVVGDASNLSAELMMGQRLVRFGLGRLQRWQSVLQHALDDTCGKLLQDALHRIALRHRLLARLDHRPQEVQGLQRNAHAINGPRKRGGRREDVWRERKELGRRDRHRCLT
jgi:hypothetical protein